MHTVNEIKILCSQIECYITVYQKKYILQELGGPLLSNPEIKLIIKATDIGELEKNSNG